MQFIAILEITINWKIHNILLNHIKTEGDKEFVTLNENFDMLYWEPSFGFYFIRKYPRILKTLCLEFSL